MHSWTRNWTSESSWKEVSLSVCSDVIFGNFFCHYMLQYCGFTTLVFPEFDKLPCGIIAVFMFFVWFLWFCYVVFKSPLCPPQVGVTSSTPVFDMGNLHSIYIKFLIMYYEMRTKQEVHEICIHNQVLLEVLTNFSHWDSEKISVVYVISVYWKRVWALTGFVYQEQACMQVFFCRIVLASTKSTCKHSWGHGTWCLENSGKIQVL